MILRYQLTLAGFLLASCYFLITPYLLMGAIADAAVTGNQTLWEKQLDQQAIQTYADRLLQGLQDLQSQTGSRPTLALIQAGSTKAAQLSQPAGLAQLLCGELQEKPTRQNGPCWHLQGEVEWHSLTRTSLTYHNPDKHWQSRLWLQRVGLFDWRAVAVELPVEEILSDCSERQAWAKLARH